MDISPKFIQGFVKRAAEYGLSEREALNILAEKHADYNYIISGETPKSSLIDSMPSGGRKMINNTLGPIMTGVSRRLGYGDPYASKKSQRAAELPLRETPPMAQGLPSPTQSIQPSQQ